MSNPPPPRRDGDPAELVRIPGAAVIQVVSGDPRRGDAVVVPLHRATVTVTRDTVDAVDGQFDWSWPATDLLEIIHGEPGWTILVVPGIVDFGVEIPAGSVEAFRDAVAIAAPLAARQHAATAAVAVAASAPVASVAVAPTPVAPLQVASPEITAPEITAPEITVSVFDPPHDAPVDPVAPLGDHSPVAVLSPPAAPAATRLQERPARGGRTTEPAAGSLGLAALDAQEISAWFGSRLVLDRVSLSMPAGKVTALIGPSGCGKSTFLRILNRMHEMIPGAAMAGQVMLDGHDVYDARRKLTDARREIGMVFQKPNPFPAMSIYDNVIASLRLTGTKASQSVKDDLVESCLSKAGLWNEVRDRLRQPGGGLSGGQQQRLCIARALAIRPRVLLMDEPCSALDPTSTRRIEETITELCSEVTIVIVTHNMQQAARVSHRCAFFLAEHGTPGVIVEHGPTRAMFGSPQDSRTDDYVNGRFG